MKSLRYRDPAVILIDQLKEVYIDGEFEPIDTTNYFPRISQWVNKGNLPR